MRPSRWFRVAAFALVLTGAPLGQAQDLPDKATRARVADWQDDCVSMWRELRPLGADAEEYAGEQGMREFLAFWQARGHPIVATVERFITQCRSVGEKVEQSGRPCRKLARDITATYRVEFRNIVRHADHFLDPAGPLDETERRLVEQYLRTCVPAFAAVLDGRDPGDVLASSGPATVGQTGPLHGSIAFSQHDDGNYAWGIAWSFDSAVGAQSEALDQCREYGGTRCAEAGWFQEACGALAIGSGNGYGAGWGDTIAEAERDALAQCHAVNDDCRVEVVRCSQSEQAGGQGRTEGKVVTIEGFSTPCMYFGPGMQVRDRVASAEDFTFEIPRDRYGCLTVLISAIVECLECEGLHEPTPEGRQCARHFQAEGIQKCGLTPQDGSEFAVDY